MAMTMVRTLLVLTVLYSVLLATTVAANSDDVKGQVAALVKRVGELETRDRLQQEKMENLESRDARQQAEIDSLKTQLRVQSQRTVAVEKLLRRLKSKVLKKTPVGQSDDHVRLQTEATDQTPQRGIKPESRTARAENENPVAFYATLGSTTVHAGRNQNMIFDHVITNVGNAYSNTLGAFVAPVPGIYVFSVNIMANWREMEHFMLSKNGKMVSMMHVRADESPDATTGLTAVLQLAKNDNVEIRFSDADGSAYGGHYSSFAGFLLQQDYDNTAAIVGK